MFNLRQLEVFRAVMLADSLTAASRQLGMSQPAVSKAVRRMEDLVGFPLFQRGRGRVQPTAEALNLFREVERVFHTVGIVEKYARDLKESKAGVLTLACTPTLSCSFVADAIARFRRERSRVRVWLQVTKTKEILELAASGRIDLGVIFTPGDHAGVNTIPLFETTLVCVMSPDHPLAQRSEIQPGDLAGEAIIANIQSAPIHELLGEAFATLDIDQKVMIGSNYTFSACALAMKGCGVAIVEPMGVTEIFPHAAVRPFAPSITIVPRIVHPRHIELSRTASSFLDALRQEATQRRAVFER
ncbi:MULTISPECIES: LysR substrate-binding domain-containing protein [unclassified Chelatococcus]|uniref:LysR substrate-binding domain-containing protein n=1 Tax=unclassified Chelatococcus TaxID=2638111 RepID=UPI001BCC0F85|nr:MULTISPECIES: LysR substrate-binding domain-containing protein [unclassified Chelatococcus]MBS7700396.1 LysR family transcriptional regulator [Chelatococcus sp. YT9]MBX3556192.1 LysR family transcriptional regulator [Chelatococcus sp.]